MARPRALLLDAMGTLIGLRQSVGQTYAAAAADHGITVSAAAINAVFPRLYREDWPCSGPNGSGGQSGSMQPWWRRAPSRQRRPCIASCSRASASRFFGGSTRM